MLKRGLHWYNVFVCTQIINTCSYKHKQMLLNFMVTWCVEWNLILILSTAWTPQVCDKLPFKK